MRAVSRCFLNLAHNANVRKIFEIAKWINIFYEIPSCVYMGVFQGFTYCKDIKTIKD